MARAKEARLAIGRMAGRLIHPGSTVLTNGGSRVVGTVLRAAAEAQIRDTGAPRFKVIYVTSGMTAAAAASDYAATEGTQTITALRAMHVYVATIPEAAVAYSMGKVDMVLVGAEGVVENGGIVSRMGTYQAGVLAKAAGKPLYVVAESHKFVRVFPLGQYDLGVDQKVLDFTTDSPATGSSESKGTDSRAGIPTPERTPEPESPANGKQPDGMRASAENTAGRLKLDSPLTASEAVDYTPPDLVTALVTEAGVLTPSAVSEELIKIWY